ncbi:MAG: zinc ribbon domain-containing protein [Candidatus Bathyarchaeia archaeon]
MKPGNVVGIIFGLVLIILPIGGWLSGEAALQGDIGELTVILFMLFGSILILSNVGAIVKESRTQKSKTEELPLPPSPPIQASTSRCPSCGKSISADFVACPYCGTTLKPKCPSCGKSISADFVACPYCGTTLKPKTEELPLPPSPPIQASTSRCPSCGKSISADFVACPYCGTRVGKIVAPGVIAVPAKQQIVISKPSSAWYLVPLFFSTLGGLIGYFCVKDRDKNMANNILLVGIVTGIVGVFIIYLQYI